MNLLMNYINKNNMVILGTLLAAALYSSCSESLEDELSPKANMCTVPTDSSHTVTFTDISTLVNLDKAKTRSGKAPEIICYTANSQDTLLYIINNKANGGWTIYSTDTRVPAIIAQSSTGNFNEDLKNEALEIWMKSISQDMRAIRKAKNSELNFTAKEIESNEDFWNPIKNVATYLSKQANLPIINQKGHYELVGKYSYTEVYDSIPRMTETNWNQEFPYNVYCPYVSKSKNSLAGCVAIAGAQMLYFLHYKLGVPEKAPSKATCNSSIYDGPNYDMEQTNYTSSIWDEMRYSDMNAAPLIANVGKRVGMHYGELASSASTPDLVQKVFVPYGISCVYADYNEDIIKSYMMENMPVLLRASGFNKDGIEGGHAFIADRYKRERIVEKTVYEWKYDDVKPNPDGTLPLLPMKPTRIVTTNSLPVISMIGINWGWGVGRNADDQWFTLTGDWINKTDQDQTNYDIQRKMIYDFNVIK